MDHYAHPLCSGAALETYIRVGADAGLDITAGRPAAAVILGVWGLLELLAVIADGAQADHESHHAFLAGLQRQ
jgi:hypothetical protein